MERDTAKHVWVKELTQGTLKHNEDAPSYIELQNGEKIYRARIYGTIVSTQELIVDDGTGSILIRSFDTEIKTKIGDPVIVIGRPRVYANEYYIVGEIVKKTDPQWIILARKQNPASNNKSPLEIIKTLDQGDGADYEQVIAKLGNKGEETITHLLAIGEIFETRPGRIKILE